MLWAPDVTKTQKLRYEWHGIKEYDPFFSLKQKK